MIPRLARALWELPWPGFIRRVAAHVLDVPPLGRFLLPHFLVGVVAIVLNEREEVLLFRHTYRRTAPWGLPSGLLERGEQPSEALIREIEEESGFDVELSPIWTVYADPVNPVLSIVFSGKLRGGTFHASKEVSEAQFFDVQGLPPLLPDQRRLLTMYMQERKTSLRA